MSFLFEYIDINPKETIIRGCLAKKIPMDKLQPFCRDIPEYETSEFNGGSKFRNGDTIMARITPCLENGKTAMVNILDSIVMKLDLVLQSILYLELKRI